MKDMCFQVDTQVRKSMVKRVRTESKLNRVMMVLLVIACFWLIASAPFFDSITGNANMPPTGPYRSVEGQHMLISAMLVMLFGMTPIPIILVYRAAKVDIKVYYKDEEALFLREAFLENYYHYRYNAPELCRTLIHFPYNGINRLELCQELGVLKVYGAYEIRRAYTPCPRQEDYRLWPDQPQTPYRVFHLYYEQSQLFVDTLSERSGVPVTIVNANGLTLDEERI